MVHVFNVDAAKEIGILPAVMLWNFQFWVEHNRANRINYYEGKYWTYNSMSALEELFPYASKKQIRTALNKLLDDGYIEKGCFNKSPYDRTAWYTVTKLANRFAPEGNSDVPLRANGDAPEGKCDLPLRANGGAAEGTPIPYINYTDNKPNINTDNTYQETDNISSLRSDISSSKKPRMKIPPDINEVKAYCMERNNEIDAEQFYDFYETKGWMIGKSKMKDWKACVRTWERNAKKNDKPVIDIWAC